MMVQSWIASFFKSFCEIQNDSASYIRTDKENWAVLACFIILAILKFPSCSFDSFSSKKCARICVWKEASQIAQYC